MHYAAFVAQHTRNRACMHVLGLERSYSFFTSSSAGRGSGPIACAYTAKTDRCMSLEIDNRTLVFQKTSALLLISSDMHLSVFAV